MPRLLAVDGAVRFAADCAEALPEVSATVLSLAGHRVSFADGRPLEGYPDDTARIVKAIAAADAVLLASPVYRGSFTGALKNLLDLTPLEALRAKPMGIVAMGATQHHYLGVDWHLRDVLAWFGALVVPTSVYLASADFVDGQLIESAKQDLKDLADAVIKLKEVTPAAGTYLGPKPLA